MLDDLTRLAGAARARLPATDVDDWSVRWSRTRSRGWSVRRGVAEPPSAGSAEGALVTAVVNGAEGWAATADVSERGLAAALERAAEWARVVGDRALVRMLPADVSDARGTYIGPGVDGAELSGAAIQGALRQLEARLRSGANGPESAIVDTTAGLDVVDVDQAAWTSRGGATLQRLRHVSPNLAATAARGAISQGRSLGGGENAGLNRQGGFDLFDVAWLEREAERIREEALVLLTAPNCPSGAMQLLLMPSQMMLQIHESIGHPLELDRILGDERNYAGTSFVTPEMFGTYRYGSELLNVTFDPTIPGELASYAFDDAGTPARREWLIRNGILERPLGSALSQRRAGLPGTANARSSAWDRPPIDRMANLNVEPGNTPLAELIARVERGVMMDNNISWSIDDSRNKFQFGCEWGRVIRDGQLAEVVKNPNYRGISATFWRSLSGVGDRGTVEVLGTPYCGKGEPNQMVRVGHASPACLFDQVDVFGGEE
ncbi:MAG: TldD/PmbA family protein [Pseudomonadota bacterium]|nr:TldD/PmbA family protein [Pseudomonadota bacterium]